MLVEVGELLSSKMQSVLRGGFVMSDPFAGISISCLLFSFELQNSMISFLKSSSHSFCPNISPNWVLVRSLLFTCCMTWPLRVSSDRWRLRSRNFHRIIKKARESQKNIYFCFIDYAKAFDCVDNNKLWKILKEMGIPDHLTHLLRNLYAGQEATVRT